MKEALKKRAESKISENRSDETERGRVSKPTTGEEKVRGVGRICEVEGLVEQPGKASDNPPLSRGKSVARSVRPPLTGENRRLTMCARMLVVMVMR